ncbi:MAG TPA: peptide deformylase [Legionellaceae bacterium]|nr:peptide deformylase [Legionellaceae bacterium]
MTIRKVLYLPDARLRRVSTEVTVFDEELQTLIDDMFETMYHTRGVGLAAAQIGINLRLSVVDVSSDRSQQLVLINPVIIEAIGETTYQEGCLSVPGTYDTVKRAETVTVRALDRYQQPFEMTASGLLGQCFQHEIGHMDGKLYIDLLSPLKRNMARRKLDKYLRDHAQKS